MHRIFKAPVLVLFKQQGYAGKRVGALGLFWLGKLFEGLSALKTLEEDPGRNTFCISLLLPVKVNNGGLGAGCTQNQKHRIKYRGGSRATPPFSSVFLM